MPIRKLLKNISPSIKFSIKENEGVLVFEHKEEVICLYLIKPTKEELDKLQQFKEVLNIKYVGDEILYRNLLMVYNFWPKANKLVFTNEEKDIIFNSESGKIRFAKDHKDKLVSKKNVLIIDDSKTIQKLLSRIIGESTTLNVLGVAGCPSEAKDIIEQNDDIDLITLDVHMPEMNGVEFLKTYLGAKNIPTVMISSVSLSEGPLIMEALSSGAYSYIQKPSIDKLNEVSQDILKELETVASSGAKNQDLSTIKTKLKFDDCNNGLIAIGSSTGGTMALEEILTTLPDSIPPIVIVQHIPAVFSKALADRLNTLCTFKVKEAEDGEFLEKNVVYIAPGGRQMKLLKRGLERRVSITDDPALNRFRPSIDYLFNTIPKLEEEKLLGVILTGMGKDGAQGLLKIKECGGFTIAQDEQSSVVFGMPKEAIALGAASKVVSLEKMSMSMVLEFNRLKKKIAA